MTSAYGNLSPDNLTALASFLFELAALTAAHGIVISWDDNAAVSINEADNEDMRLVGTLKTYADRDDTIRYELDPGHVPDLG